VLAPRGFPGQRSSAGHDDVLFHCDGAAINNIVTRYRAWVARRCASVRRRPHDLLDLWVQEAGERFITFEKVTDEDR